MAEQLYSVIDKNGTVYRHWRCTEAEARRFATKVQGRWDWLVDGTGRKVATFNDIFGY